MSAQPGNVPSGRYTIAAASKLTGVSCHALRAWERRYGFPVPGRSQSGHRRYDSEQIERLRLVVSQIHNGRPVGDVMSSLQATPEGRPEMVEPPGPDALQPLTEALMAGDLNAAEAAYERVTAGLSAGSQIGRVIEPLLIDVGERWFRGDCQIYQERAVSGFLRRKLMILLDQLQVGEAQEREVALIGTPQGDRHEGGALMLSVLLEAAGWRALPMGTDLPTAEYQKAIDLWRPAAVCISFVMSRNVKRRFAELGGLSGAPVFVGGRSLVNYRGLAKRFGLQPLVGSATEVVPRLIKEAREWAKQNGSSGGQSGVVG